jgi:hypothetical protein
MRTLRPAPDSVVDPATGSARFGSFRGGIAHIDLGSLAPSRWQRLTRHKRWLYVAVASDELFVGLALVHVGYASNLFAYAFDAGAGRMLFDRSLVAPPFACTVGDTAGEGCTAELRSGSTRVSVARASGSSTYQLAARFGALTLQAALEARSAPPALTAIAPIPTGVASVTEKRALLDVTGELAVDAERRSLDGALAGYDYTNGLLGHRTAWRWGFLLGRATSGERVGMNLVQGFVGEAECGVWIDGELHPLGEGRFAWNEAAPLDPWRVTTADGGVELDFAPGGMHAEHRNLGLVSSHFIQPVGAYAGTIALAGRAPLVVERALGVTEDQNVRW